MPTLFFCFDEKQTAYSKIHPIAVSTDQGSTSAIHMMCHFQRRGIPNCSRWHNVEERLPFMKKIEQTTIMVSILLLRFAGQKRNWIARMPLLLSHRTMITSRRATWKVASFVFTVGARAPQLALD